MILDGISRRSRAGGWWLVCVGCRGAAPGSSSRKYWLDSIHCIEIHWNEIDWNFDEIHWNVIHWKFCRTST